MGSKCQIVVWLKWESSAEFNMQISLKGNEVERCVNEVQKSTGKKSLEVGKKWALLTPFCDHAN